MRGAGILDGDTLAGTVPAGVHEVSGGAYFLHSLHEFLTVLGGVQGEERSSEASGEGGGRLGDAALCAGELGGEAAQEVIFGLLGGQLGNGRKYSERIGGQEDDLGSVAGLRYRLNDVLDVVDRVGYAGVLGNALVGEVDLAVDVGLVLLGEVDYLGVAAALEVEDTVIVPAVLVITDQAALGICGERVVLPVPERPKKMAVSPSSPQLAEQCMEAMPRRGRR